MITQQQLHAVLDYNPEDGLLRWKVRYNNSVKVGKPLGVLHKGYLVVTFMQKQYPIHRLVWLYVYGELPKLSIDHIDRNRINNRVSNLILANHSQQRANTPLSPRNKSGYKGVIWNKKASNWQANIIVNGRLKYLGHFNDPKEAALVYARAAKEAFGEFAHAPGVDI